jgi:hypothetical protein
MVMWQSTIPTSADRSMGNVTKGITSTISGLPVRSSHVGRPLETCSLDVEKVAQRLDLHSSYAMELFFQVGPLPVASVAHAWA